ncbi:unnamed protein product, partial [Rotaria socialis]
MVLRHADSGLPFFQSCRVQYSGYRGRATRICGQNSSSSSHGRESWSLPVPKAVEVDVWMQFLGLFKCGNEG